jgi:hypothetical protein
MDHSYADRTLFWLAREQNRFCFIERVMRSQLLSEINPSGRPRWLQVLNTARYRRGMRRQTHKFWCSVNKLIVYAPKHYMAVSVKGASRGSGATVTLDGTELVRNGEKPGTTKLTNNAAGPHPPVTCPQPPLKGGRRGASGGSRDGGCKRVPCGVSTSPHREDLQRWTLRITLLAWALSVSSWRCPLRRPVPVDNTLSP